MLYINDNILSRRRSNHPIFSDLELIAFGIHQHKRWWLFLGIYKPPSQSEIEFTNKLSLVIDHYLPKYENLILIGDFNLSTENHHLNAVIRADNLNNLIKKACCSHSTNPIYIDLIINQQKKSIYVIQYFSD